MRRFLHQINETVNQVESLKSLFHLQGLSTSPICVYLSHDVESSENPSSTTLPNMAKLGREGIAYLDALSTFSIFNRGKESSTIVSIANGTEMESSVCHWPNRS